MAARDIVPVPGAWFEDTLESASPDLLREMIKGLAQRMMHYHRNLLIVRRSPALRDQLYWAGARQDLR